MPPAPIADNTSYEPTRTPGPIVEGKGVCADYRLPGDDAIIAGAMTSLLIAALACERLASVTLPNAAVTTAQAVTTGVFEQARGLPPFCRVAVTLKPSSDSDIKMELWLPAEKWNSKF